MPPRTVDNLGMDASNRYAQDQKELDKTFIKEALSIPSQTEIEVTSPSFGYEIDALLQSGPSHSVWASFRAPLNYTEQRRLFTHQLIPSLGSEEKQESQAQKILSKWERDQKQKQDSSQEEDPKKKKEKELKEGEKEKEKKILISFLNAIALYDKLIVDINSRRSQYQKG